MNGTADWWDAPLLAPPPRRPPPLIRDLGHGAGPRRTFVVIVLAVVAFVGFIVGNGLGLAYAVWFWAVWIGFALLHRRLFAAPFATVLPWLFPCWALASLLWSRDPTASGRNALELMTTTAVALAIPYALTARGIALALFCALFAGSIAGLAFGHDETIYVGSIEANQGIFGSKNSFAMFASMLLLAGLAVLLDGGMPRWARLAAIAALPVAAYELQQAHSVGAIVGAVLAALVLLAVRLVQVLPSRARGAMVIGAVLLGLVLLVVAASFAQPGAVDAALADVGKDSTFTGRAYLWQRAQETIDQHRWLGVGFQAYWRQGFLEPEGLWRYLMIAGRQGVTMHNLYYETMIEVGMVGFVLLLSSMVTTLLAAVAAAIVRPDAMGAFSVAACLFFFSRIFLETEFLAPFIMGSMVFPLVWSHSHRNFREWQAAARPGPAFHPRATEVLAT